MRLKIKENIFHVKVVTSKFDKAQGMMNRRFTDEFNGMLFLMDDDENCFWMKNCIISLDIIFIEGNTISKIFKFSRYGLSCLFIFFKPFR